MTQLRTIMYPCPSDRSMQPAQVQFAPEDQPRPLVVALHTWSCSYDADCSDYAEYCEKHGAHLIFPHFRGPNWTPDALGSDLAVADLAAAVNFMLESVPVDPDRIYLVGGSGGGHMALLMAGRVPELWTAVSAWCPISDVAAWHKQCTGTRFSGYAENIEKACGNPPDPEETAYRSPVTYLANAVKLPVDIATGIHDGHQGSVPVSHAMYAFNCLAKPEDRFTDEEIAYVVTHEAPPPHFPEPEQDPAYGSTKIHIRRQSGNTRITLFEGAHDSLTGIGVAWLMEQRRSKPPVWDIGSLDIRARELAH